MKDRSSVVSRLKLGSVVAVFSLSLMGGRGAYGVTDLAQLCPMECNTWVRNLSLVAQKQSSNSNPTSTSAFINGVSSFVKGCIALCTVDNRFAIAVGKATGAEGARPSDGGAVSSPPPSAAVASPTPSQGRNGNSNTSSIGKPDVYW